MSSRRDVAGHRSPAPTAGTSRTVSFAYRLISTVTVFAMLFGGLLLLNSSDASAQSTTTTTDYLNLRTEPSLDGAIVTVMPVGATVSIIGDPSNGFYPVSYDGLAGYASGDYLAIGGGSGAATASDGATGTAYVIDGALNLRTGPGTDYGVVTVMPDGAAVDLTGEYGNGFLGVVYNGSPGYAFADFLSQSGGGSSGSGSVPVSGDVIGSATVIDGALNLRSGPGTNYDVITVMPGGANVDLTGDSQNGFVGIIYNGTAGFAYADYLSTGGSSDAGSGSDAGSVAVGDSVVGSATVFDGALNLRTGPSTSYSIISTMPDGAVVDVMGDPQGGWYPVSFGGTKGWASGQWLNMGSSGPAAPAEPEDAPAPSTGATDIVSIIYAAADRYGQPRADMLRVARCESVLDPNAYNASSGASGLFQFLPGTWASTPYADQNIFDAEANANAAGWMWSVGRRNEWVCQ